jgi:predicted DNA-binding transcriptional regulator AlpA
MKHSERDYALAERVSRLGDDAFVGVPEVAAFTGFAEITIQQKKIKGFPLPMPGTRKLRWRLGQIRAWGK